MIGEREFAGRREAIDLIVPLAGHHSIPALAMTLVVGKPPEKRQALRYLADEVCRIKAQRTLRTSLRASRLSSGRCMLESSRPWTKIPAGLPSRRA